MIIGPDFVWLHFPKCAGVSVQSALRKLYGNRADVYFDDLYDHSNVIWHHSLDQRRAYDPSFDPSGKRVVCCIRRLPHWILSRIHFEATRGPDYHIATRAMLLRGEFYEQSGATNSADNYMNIYALPRVDTWIRVEHVVDDLTAAFQLAHADIAAVLKHENPATTPYIKALKLWFTPEDLAGLYKANPLWSSVEERVYGSLLTL